MNWYLRMADKGVQVKALDTYVTDTLSIDDFYYDMYELCGNDFNSIYNYCMLFKLSNAEVLEAINILKLIHSKV
jgi:hypothetical protein